MKHCERHHKIKVLIIFELVEGGVVGWCSLMIMYLYFVVYLGHKLEQKEQKSNFQV